MPQNKSILSGFPLFILHHFWYVYHLVELALRDAITVVDDSGRLEAGGLVELDEQLPNHGGQVLDDVLAVLLHPHCGTVSAGVGIHTANDLRMIYSLVSKEIVKCLTSKCGRKIEKLFTCLTELSVLFWVEELIGLTWQIK